MALCQSDLTFEHLEAFVDALVSNADSVLDIESYVGI